MKMKRYKLLLVGLSFLLLIVFSCAWKITHVNTDKIRKECKIECQTYEVSSDNWCNCMNLCLDIDEGSSFCPTDSTNTN